jgi:hypothetical protein
MTDLRETFADVTALIPRYSWEIMDEAQRDDLMASVVLPRYMKTTADGVQLGPTAWAEIVGATADAIRGRVQRLQASHKSDDSERARRDTLRQHRAARQVLREADEATLGEIIAALPAEKVEAVARAAHARQIETIRESGGGEPSLSDADYAAAREKFSEIDRSWLLITEMNVAIGRVHVAGIESILDRATPAQRRELVERWPDHIALLQHGIDLAKTSKLKAVRTSG